MSETTSGWKSVGDDSGTERMRVPAGWLYRVLDITSGQTTTAMAFVPDPEQQKRVVIKRR